MAPRTRFRTLRVHDDTWYAAHRLADKLGLSLADTIALLIDRNLRSLGIEPLTEDDLEDTIPPASDPSKTI